MIDWERVEVRGMKSAGPASMGSEEVEKPVASNLSIMAET